MKLLPNDDRQKGYFRMLFAVVERDDFNVNMKHESPVRGGSRFIYRGSKFLKSGSI